MTDKPKMKPLIVLKKFFGFKEGQSLPQFAAEVAKLSAEEKLELARLAAEQLGVELDINEGSSSAS